MHTITIVALMAAATSVKAHMELSFPAPFRSTLNPHAVQSQIDYSMTSPLTADGSNFPCKGYQVDMDQPTGAGASVATFTAGSPYNFTVTGGAVHGGGSCQAALSYDQGKTIKVIHSFIGSCPLSSGQSFDFTVPSDAPSGSAMFVWTWYNMIGNREIYQNCASITIAGGSSKKSRRAAPAVAFSARPDLFVANLGNGCTTVEGKEVLYPDPGPSADVTTKQTVTDDSGSFTGTCAAVKGVGGADAATGSSGGSGSASGGAGSASATTASASSQASSVSATTSTSSSIISIQIIPTSSPSASSSVAAPSASSASSLATSVITPASSASASSITPSSTGTSSALKPSEDGQCSGSQTCAGSSWGHCCSSAGYCGIGDAWCGTGCQAAFGSCGAFTNGTASAAARRSRIFRG